MTMDGFLHSNSQFGENIPKYLTQRRRDAEEDAEFANYPLNSASLRLGVRKFEMKSFEKSLN
jgi:hypothetical protein